RYAPDVLLAEIEVYHSRPAQPTRRLSLGALDLPVDPSPGLGGLLLGAVVARHSRELSVDDLLEVTHLLRQVERGERVVQPRLRHRYQIDRHGLAVSRHRLESDGDEIRFDFATTGTDLAQVLGAVYALERLAGEHRRTIAPLLDRATRWRGPIGASLIQHLAGARSSELSALADPRGWAMNILGLDPTGPTPDRRDIMRCYRARMREIHPDHGGDSTDASTSIIELNEARRILTNPLVAV
ncbi:MAG: J domain-containing protein, partial [Ilumatobacteraceae bacterium]